MFITSGSGQKSFYQIKDPSLAVTSLFERKWGGTGCGYQMPSATKGRFRDWEIFNSPLKELNTQAEETP